MGIDGWRAYYIGNREYDSSEYDWEEIPTDEVLAINVFVDTAITQTIYGYDWYFHIPGTDLFGGDDHGDINERYPGAIIKRGKWIPYREWIDFQSYVKSDTWDK